MTVEAPPHPQYDAPTIDGPAAFARRPVDRPAGSVPEQRTDSGDVLPLDLYEITDAGQRRERAVTLMGEQSIVIPAGTKPIATAEEFFQDTGVDVGGDLIGIMYLPRSSAQTGSTHDQDRLHRSATKIYVFAAKGGRHSENPAAAIFLGHNDLEEIRAGKFKPGEEGVATPGSPLTIGRNAWLPYETEDAKNPYKEAPLSTLYRRVSRTHAQGDIDQEGNVTIRNAKAAYGSNQGTEIVFGVPVDTLGDAEWEKGRMAATAPAGTASAEGGAPGRHRAEDASVQRSHRQGPRVGLGQLVVHR